MPIFNVLAAVVELVKADTEAEAIASVYSRLYAAGFVPYDEDKAEAESHGYTLPHAFAQS
jgi:hypothetical protein